MNPSRKEQRRYFRVTPEEKLPIRVDINGEDFIEVLTAVDISEKGIGLMVPDEFKGCSINMPVTLVISLPSPIKFSFRTYGKIKHVKSKKFGVHFLDISLASRNKLRKYIEYRLKDESWWTRMKFRWGL